MGFIGFDDLLRHLPALSPLTLEGRIHDNDSVSSVEETEAQKKGTYFGHTLIPMAILT